MECAKELAKVKLVHTSMGKTCLSKYQNETACEGMNLKYRSADGSCNNLKHSFWGKANTAYKRLLFPVYKDGKRYKTIALLLFESFLRYHRVHFIYLFIICAGLGSIRELPNSRELSSSLVNDENSPDSTKTIAMAFWTIFIGHDLSHTAVSSMRKF